MALTSGEYMSFALECARFLATHRLETEAGVAWPINPEKPGEVALDLYYGVPGVALFLAELARATGDPVLLGEATAGADHVRAEWPKAGAEFPAGLYTGLGGLVFAFGALARLGAGERFAAEAARCVEALAARARQLPDGIEWNEATDVIYGSAGIGLALLDHAARTGDGEALALARAAGRRLVALAEPSAGGLYWRMTPTFYRVMPGFSHGTAGVAFFLARLFAATGESSFLGAALAGAAHLTSIAAHRGDSSVIRHHDGDGEDLFYYGWCHGAPGTARLFVELRRTTGDPRHAEFAEALTRGVLESGIPERRSPGFWNNVSQCCGDAGVAQHFLDLKLLAGDPRADGMIDRLVAEILRRATRDDRGLRVLGAEERVHPDRLVAHTGYMLGSAGLGTLFLRLALAARGDRWLIDLPDTPFTS